MIYYRRDGLKDEFYQLDNRLQVIIVFMAGIADSYYHRNITVTHLIRTQEQQDLFYKDNPEYQESPWKSVHQVKRGADISGLHYTAHEMGRIAGEINASFRYGGGKNTCLVHDIGLGNHFHLQVPDRGGRQFFI